MSLEELERELLESKEASGHVIPEGIAALAALVEVEKVRELATIRGQS